MWGGVVSGFSHPAGEIWQAIVRNLKDLQLRTIKPKRPSRITTFEYEASWFWVGGDSLHGFQLY
jgi:hypothetical protein